MAKLSDSMRELLNGRHYATLATLNEDGSIHLTPVWYLFEREGFFVSTASSDRKVRNILARPEASLVIDIRKLGSERWVSASGTAEIIRGERAKEISTKIGQRYLTPVALEDPRVGPIIAAAGDVMIGLTPQAWRSVVYLKRADKSSAPHRRNQRAINCQALTAITKSTEPQ